MNRALPVLAALFVLGAAWAWLRSGRSPGPAQAPAAPETVPAAETSPAAPSSRGGMPAPAARPGSATGEAAPPETAPAEPPDEPEETVSIRPPRESDVPDPARDPEGFEQRLRANQDPLLPDIEQVLGARGLPSSAAVRSAAWSVARNWAVFQQAERLAADQVPDATLRAALSEERKKILVSAPREQLAKLLGGTVDPGVWSDLEAAGLKHPLPPRPKRQPLRPPAFPLPPKSAPAPDAPAAPAPAP